MTAQQTAKGLAGVVVDDSAISDVQAQGRLLYRGTDINELATLPFTHVASLVVLDELGPRLDEFLARHANLSAWETDVVLKVPADTHPMQVIQGMLALFGAGLQTGQQTSDTDDGLPGVTTEVRAGLIAAAKIPALVATHLTRAPVKLIPELDYARRFLLALQGAGADAASQDLPDAELVEAFNMAQILQLEHSFNAGTFAARVVASTLANVQAAMSAGVGALSGALHGGADQAAIEIADGLVDADSARAYIDATLEANGRVPGMGHREYRVRDPRAVLLESRAQKLARKEPDLNATLNILRALDDHFKDRMAALGKEVHPNVEFYKGLVYRAIGLPNHYFTAGFAMARVFGYVAHFAESREDNRIYRPQARYVGR